MHVVGTAGHVDHGKSTLIRALTGIDPDRFAEEKRRGLTIDLGFAWLTLPSGREVGFVDVPGHERFIRNMLAGVGGVAATVFVVAADEGWMPQSTEHLHILDLLDVRHGVVALTRTDRTDDEGVELAASEVRDRVAGSVLEDAPIVPVSAPSGAGLPELVAALDDVLAAVPAAPDDGAPRLYVDRAFTITGAGTVATGTLVGGVLRSGDEITIAPAGRRARIRSLQTHRTSVTEAVPGSRVAVNLTGVEKADLQRGDALVVRDALVSTRFAASVRAVPGLEHALPERGAYELFAGSAQTRCRIRFLDRDARTPLAAGDTALAQLATDRALPLRYADRFVIRDAGRWETVAGGMVLDPAPGRLRRRHAETLDRLRARETAGRDGIVGRVLAERGASDVPELARLTGLGSERVRASLGDAVVTEHAVLSPEHAERLVDRAVAGLRTHHAERPLDAGMPREALRAALDLDARVFADLVAGWAARGRVVADGTTIRLPDHRAVLDAADRAAADRALETLRAAGASPPLVGEVGLGAELLRALERAGEVVRLTADIAYPSDVWVAIRERVVSLIREGGPVTVAQVRDALGATRRYVVPLLERLDAEGVTSRRGDVRSLGPRSGEAG